MNNLQIVKFLHILLITCLTFLSVGCLREDRSNCSDGIILKFKYLNMPGQEAKSSFEAIEKLSVFVFDGNGLFVCAKSDSTILMNDNYTMQLPLYNGKYQFVVWAGLADCYSLTKCIPAQTAIQNFTLRLKQDNGYNFSIPSTPLYHGHHELVTLDPSQTAIITIGLQQITNTIRIIVHNAEANTQVSIEDNNSLYSYRGEILPDNLLSYTPHTTTTDLPTNTYQAEFQVMRLQPTSEARLKIYSPPGTLQYNEKLISGLLGVNPNINFDTDHDFTIEITFDAHYVPISILVNGWDIILENVN